MKFMVRAGWDDFEVESENPNVQYAAVVWEGNKKHVWMFEEEAQANRKVKAELNKRMLGRGNVYWMRSV